jgi:hypothetical protein
MTTKVFTDIIRNVGIEGDDPLTVRPDPDLPFDNVEVLAHGESAIGHWGKVRFSIPREMAAALGQALIDASKEPA